MSSPKNPVVRKPVIVKWEVDGHNSCDLIARVHCGYATTEANCERLNTITPTVVVIEQEQTSYGCSILEREDS